MLYSFDIYDTCLRRLVFSSHELRGAWANRVFRELAGREASPTDWAALVALREKAEQELRDQSAAEDVPLEAIYAGFPASNPWGFASADLQRIELELEASWLRPFPALLTKIVELASQGQRVIYISDMYLPKGWLREQLLKQGFPCEPDQIYVSGDDGLTKARGGIWPHIREVEQVEYTDWIHVGDHPQGDIAVPQQLGIQVQPVAAPRYPEPGRRLIRRFPPSHAVAPLAVGALREAGREVELHPSVTDFLLYSVVPLIAHYAAWVMEQARKQGVRRLYFLSRDGYLIQQAVEALLGDKPDLECRYLYASREVLARAAQDEAAQAYFTESGIWEADCMAVDWSGSLNAQADFCALTRQRGQTMPPFLYFAVYADRRSMDEAGAYQAWVVSELDARHADDAATVLLDRMPAFEEGFLGAPHGRVTGYVQDADGVRACMAAVHPLHEKLVPVLAGMLTRYGQALRQLNVTAADLVRLLPESMAQMADALRWPEPELVKFLSPYAVSRDVQEAGAQSLAEPLTWKQIFKNPHLHAWPPSGDETLRIIWPELSWLATGPLKRRVALLMRRVGEK